MVLSEDNGVSAQGVRVKVAFDTSLGVLFTVLTFAGKGALVVDGEKARQAFADSHGLPLDEVYDLIFHEKESTADASVTGDETTSEKRAPS